MATRKATTHKIFKYDPAAPLRKVKGESYKANTALRDYYMMGGARSLRKLLDEYIKQADYKQTTESGPVDPPPSTSFNTIGKWSRIYRWQDRIADQTLLDSNERLAKWSQRRDEIREADYGAGVKLRALADEILEAAPDYIIEKIIRGKGKEDPDTILKALDGHLLVKVLNLASDLQRTAADLPTENIAINNDGENINRAAEAIRSKLMERITAELEKSNE